MHDEICTNPDLHAFVRHIYLDEGQHLHRARFNRR
jgi:hypothetical protein